MYAWYIGLDLGQSNDYSALSILEEPVWLTEEQALKLNAPTDGWVSPARLTQHQLQQAHSLNYYHGRPAHPPLTVPHLQRFELHTPYPEIVGQVARLLHTPPLRSGAVTLIVDKTGVGAPVIDLFRQGGMTPIPVIITAGNTVSADPDDGTFRVPKRDLVSAVAVLLEQRRLRIAEALPDTATLSRELQEFRRRVTPEGTDQYASWRESIHDDLVLATALAVWYRGWFNQLLDLANARRANRKTGLRAAL